MHCTTHCTWLQLRLNCPKPVYAFVFNMPHSIQRKRLFFYMLAVLVCTQNGTATGVTSNVLHRRNRNFILTPTVYVYNISWGGGQCRKYRQSKKTRQSQSLLRSLYFSYWPTSRSTLYLLCSTLPKTVHSVYALVKPMMDIKCWAHSDPSWISLANTTQNWKQPKPVYKGRTFGVVHIVIPHEYY